MDLTQIINIFSHYYILTYILLFLGSYFETVFIISFFVPGEFFFLSGSILAGMGYLNIWIVILVLYLGGILGDITSYFLGKKYGINIYKEFEKKRFFNKYINKKNYKKEEIFFKKYGIFSIFFTRFLGPISWITPFLSGQFKLKFLKFLKYDILAVILSIGIFILIGFFGGFYYQVLLSLIFKYIFLILFSLISLFFIYYYLKKKKYLNLIKKNIKSQKYFIIKYSIKYFTFISIILSILFILFLSILFFNQNISAIINNNNNNFDNLNITPLFYNNCSNLNVYYKDNVENSIQRINVILYTKNNISSFMNNSWIRNKIFQKNNITIKQYYHLFFEKNLPISNIYFLNKSQDIAFQEKTNSYISREHIRFWYFNSDLSSYNNLILGSISKDNGLTIMLYNNFITPVHQINPNIDFSRDLFKKYLLNSKKFKCDYINTKCSINKIEFNLEEINYYTDAKILVCFEK